MVPNHVRYQTALHLEDFNLNYFFNFISGRGGGTRTPGARFWRPTLYQLSYTPMLFNIKVVDHQGLEPQTYRL